MGTGGGTSRSDPGLCRLPPAGSSPTSATTSTRSARYHNWTRRRRSSPGSAGARRRPSGSNWQPSAPRGFVSAPPWTRWSAGAASNPKFRRPTSSSSAGCSTRSVVSPPKMPPARPSPAAILLLLLLPCGAIQGGTGRDSRATISRETPAQGHDLVCGGTGRTGDPRAHHPKVGGSNPAPATNLSAKAQVRDLGLAR